MSPNGTTVAALAPERFAEAAALVASQPLFERYGTTAASLERAWHALAATEALVLGALDEGRVIGVAWLVPRGAFARSPYLRLLAVAPDAAGRGVGGLLMEAGEGWAFARADDLFLLVNEDNAAAIGFYERRGYRAIGQVHDYVRPGLHERIMRKRRPSSPTR